MNIEHVGVYSKDPAALAVWYATVIGLKELRRIEREGRPPVLFLGGENGVILEILPTDASGGERVLVSLGHSHLGIAVADLDAERKRLAGCGIELEGVRKTSNGWRIGYFKDPEGNTLELIQRKIGR